MSGESKRTPGPWRVEDGTTLIWGNCNPDDHSTRGMGYPIAEARINPSGNWSTGPYADEGAANARLIAAAPDHALICWAMCVGAGRWVPWGDGRGEFCMNGLHYTTKLDEFGCPVVTPNMRAALEARATGESSK